MNLTKQRKVYLKKKSTNYKTEMQFGGGSIFERICPSIISYYYTKV